MKQKMKFMNWMQGKLKSTDMYAQSVKLTFKGKTSFSTLLGGVVSTWVILLIVIYALILINTVFTRGNSTKSVTKIIRDLTNDPTKHYIGKGTFALGVRLTGLNSDLLLDPSYFELNIQSVTYNRDYGALPQNSTRIEIEKWGDNFPFISDKELYKRLGLSNFYCPINTDYYISSNFNSKDYTVLEIRLRKWSSANCKSDTEISNILSTNLFEIAFINTYFDFDDYGNPIKTYYEDVNVYGLVDSFTQVPRIEIQQNQVKVNNNILFNSASDSYDFYSVGDKNTLFFNKGMTNGAYLIVNIFLSQRYDLYERNVYTLFDMFGQVGGSFELLKILGLFLVSSFSSKLFKNEILSKLYHVLNPNDPTPKVHVKDTTTIKDFDSWTIGKNRRNKFNPPPLSYSEDAKFGDIRRQETDNSLVELKPKAKIPKLNKDIKLAKEGIKARRVYTYKPVQILGSYIKPLICCKSQRASINLFSEVYKKGVDKFDEELDWVNIVESLRQLKFIVNTMLSENQQVMLNFHRDKLILPKSDGLQFHRLSQLITRNIFNSRLRNIPSKSDKVEEIQNYTKTVDEFFDRYWSQPITDEDRKAVKLWLI